MKNRLVQIALSLAFLGLLIQIVLIAPSQIRDSETKAAVIPTPELGKATETNHENDVDQSMKGMHMIETQEGGKEWEMWADKATSLKAKEVLELEVVKTIFFSSNGVTFTVTGKKGNVQVKSKNMRIEGDVLTRSSNGYIFRTESMEYDSKTRRLTAPSAVEMIGPKDAEGHSLHLTGVGMKASLQETNMEILSDVKAEKRLENGRRAFIKSHRSLFSNKDKSARFLEDVVLDLDSMRITGPEARFQYDPKRDVVKSVNVTGGARVSDTDKWATAQNVIIDFEANKYIFRGNPRVVQNNDELRGEEIVFLDGGKQVQVKSARARVDEKRLEKKN
jgi:LPS export ABC transporter protein LptC